MKKVLIVGMTAGVGGVETFICNVLKRLDPTKHEIYILMHEKMNAKYIKELENVRYKLIEVSGIKQNPLKYFIEINKVYRQYDFDVVHLNECDAKMFAYCLPLIIKRKPKLIVHCHSTSPRKEPIFHYIMKFFQNMRANVKWACSDDAYKYMFGKSDEKIIIHNGIELNKYIFNDEIRARKRKELNLTNKTVLCSVARFTKEKNHSKIIDIFFEYNKVNSSSILLLVGEGPLKEAAEAKVKELGLSKKVLFLGVSDKVNEILMASDAFLLPSLFEGLPFVSLEGQTSGLTFFASNNVSKEIAITELIHFISLDKNSKIWADEIEKTLSKDYNRRDSKYSNEIRKAGYDIEDVAEQIEKEYGK